MRQESRWDCALFFLSADRPPAGKAGQNFRPQKAFGFPHTEAKRSAISPEGELRFRKDRLCVIRLAAAPPASGARIGRAGRR